MSFIFFVAPRQTHHHANPKRDLVEALDLARTLLFAAYLFRSPLFFLMAQQLIHHLHLALASEASTPIRSAAYHGHQHNDTQKNAPMSRAVEPRSAPVQNTAAHPTTAAAAPVATTPSNTQQEVYNSAPVYGQPVQAEEQPYLASPAL